MSIETDDEKMEELLLENGFNKKNIAVMKRAIVRGEDPDETLFDITLELKNRFFNGCLCLCVCLVPLIFYSIKGELDGVIVACILMLFGFIVVYYIVPMNLAWKAYLFFKKTEGQ